ncbi:hypothetical protein G7Y89_g3256 [Cudoniella acicularis]|uniref:Ig-like domain-containing protein n=1 Tax=Cudoniella acicularis TaxID=354080 RepID=A0A8H4RTN8_9HELO|nr:hypothetical protein G7Y89_g3256 [Cudoniella acicularis]
MKPSFGLTLIASAALVVADDCDCGPSLFGPAPIPVDTHSAARVVPVTELALPYNSNTSSTHVNVNHTMRYPSVVLETIASVVGVDCSATSVQMTFNDSSIFDATQATWTAEGNFVLVTNHLGDCDAELERGFFLVNSLSWDNSTLVCTASSSKANVSTTAESTQITFGKLPTNATVATRDIVVDPTYTLNADIALPSTTLYSYSPYLTVSGEGSFDANVIFSGYLAYNWLTFKVDELYFDLDTAFDATVSVTADVTSSYNTSFTYSPSTLFYGLTVPGLVELGPELKFAVEADISASEAVTLTGAVGIAIADGSVHLDLLSSSGTTTSGWVPTYSASADISGEVLATLDPYATLTVEIAINFFSGLLDLSSGVTFKPGFENEFLLSAAEGVDLTGVNNITSSGTCSEGLLLESNFSFAIDAFATEWYSTELYSVTVPILDECFSWQS